MGWHVGLTYEEMQEQFGDKKESGASTSTTVSDASPAATPTACTIQDLSSGPPPPPEEYKTIYHLCRKLDWEASVESKQPYFPRTFLDDGKFTRASLFLEDMVDVANEFYSSLDISPSSEEWIVLELDPQFLYHGLGIPILAAVAPESKDVEIKCLQIFGGLTTHPAFLKFLVLSVYPMKRRDIDGKFIGMLQNQPVLPGLETDCGCNSPTTEGNDDGDDDDDELLKLTMIEEAPSMGAESKTKKKKGFFSKFSTKKSKE